VLVAVAHLGLVRPLRAPMIIRDQFGLRSDTGNPITPEEYAEYLKRHPEEAPEPDQPPEPPEHEEPQDETENDDDGEEDDLWPRMGCRNLDEVFARFGIPAKAERAIRGFLDDFWTPTIDFSPSAADRYIRWLTSCIADAIVGHNQYAGTGGIGDELYTVAQLDLPDNAFRDQLYRDLRSLADILVSISGHQHSTTEQHQPDLFDDTNLQ